MLFDFSSVKINKEFLFKYITQEDIFLKYLGLPIDETILYTNPLRPSKNPESNYFYGKDRLWFIDFAGRSYDCFNIVEEIYGVKYYRACEIIANDFGLIDNPNPVQRRNIQSTELRKETVKLSYKRYKYYSKEHLDYWRQFGVPIDHIDLFNWGIHPIDAAWLESGDSRRCIYDIDHGSNRKKPAFCYTENGEIVQFYFPHKITSSHIKHITATNSVLQGFNNLPKRGDYVIITKSRKDAFLMSFFGLTAVAVMTERKVVNKGYMENLYQRFGKLYTLFDNDATGRRLSHQMRDIYTTKPLFFPFSLSRDFSDTLLQIGINEMVDLVESFKDKYRIG